MLRALVLLLCLASAAVAQPPPGGADPSIASAVAEAYRNGTQSWVDVDTTIAQLPAPAQFVTWRVEVSVDDHGTEVGSVSGPGTAQLATTHGPNLNPPPKKAGTAYLFDVEVWLIEVTHTPTGDVWRLVDTRTTGAILE